MNYNTEVIQEAAEQLAGMLKAAVEEQQRAGEETATIAQAENEMREMLKRIGMARSIRYVNAIVGQPGLMLFARLSFSIAIRIVLFARMPKLCYPVSRLRRWTHNVKSTSLPPNTGQLIAHEKEKRIKPCQTN